MERKTAWQSDNQTEAEAVEKMTDQAQLAEIARNAKSPKVREKAVVKLNDPSLIASIAKTDSDMWVCASAVLSLEKQYQNTLADIAKNAAGWFRRMPAALKLNGVHSVIAQEVYKDLAMNDENSYGAFEAVKNIKSESVLADVAASAKDSNIRKAADKRLTELSKPDIAAINITVNSGGQIAEAQKLKTALIDLMASVIVEENSTQSFEELKKLARELLPGYENELFLYIADNGADLETRKKAISEITDHAALRAIVEGNAEEYRVRVIAMGKTDFYSCTTTINTEVIDLRDIARERLKTQDLTDAETQKPIQDFLSAVGKRAAERIRFGELDAYVQSLRADDERLKESGDYDDSDREEYWWRD